ncbi:MAG: hypothetical protein FD135_1277 [Comamonadaceae bacterium]|nr:MAG: hypothetical protein FD135_1277 [Comamonadaceae bacterium]
MKDTYKFALAPASLALGHLTGHSYRHQQVIDPWPKPVYAIHTHGWQVIDVPSALVKALGRTRLQKTRAAQVLLCAHFETEQAIYQLHVDTRVQLALHD